MEKKNLNLFLMLLGSFVLGGATGAYFILNMRNKSEPDDESNEPYYELNDEIEN